MSKGKLFSVICALLVVVVGGLYLWLDFFSIPLVLFVSAGAVALMGLISVLEARGGEKGSIAGYIPAICYFVLSVAVVISALIYILK